MASQFQNRLIGAVVIVAVGVIVLPSLFDGKKKHYEEEFASIPLVPKEGDDQDTEILPSVNHSLPANNEAMETPDNDQLQVGDVEPPPLVSTTPGNNQSVGNPAVVSPTSTPQTKPIESKPPEVKPKQAEIKPVQAKPLEAEKPPVGQAFIVQLGALKNADKVNEIVATLKLSGYRVYTIPSTPVQGKLTRVVVGPEPSRQKLEAALPELKQLSGLKGEVKAFSPVR